MPTESFTYIVDDDEAARDSLDFLLKSAGIATKSFDSGTAFLKILPDVQTGCIVTDVRMPDITGIDLLKRVRQTKPELPVIVITGHGDIALAVEAMKMGAVDFLEKPFDDGHLLAAVRTALNRGANAAERNAKAADIQHRLDALSGRERQVLEGLIAGNPNKIIAFDLGISPRTVEIYRANLMTKMEANSLSDLVRMALAAGILDKTAD